MIGIIIILREGWGVKCYIICYGLWVIILKKMKINIVIFEKFMNFYEWLEDLIFSNDFFKDLLWNLKLIMI